MAEDGAAFEQGPIRPPNEADSLLVRVTRNCPWNRCRFCPVYKGADFELRPVADVEADIAAMAALAARIAPELGPGGEITRELMAALRACGRHDAGQIVRFLADGGRTAFLQDANSLIVPAADLARVLRALRRAFPSLERVTTYARSHTVTKRTAADLIRLREAGLDRVHVGVESGSGEVLRRMEKGATAERHVRAGALVTAAGLELSAYVMPGLGGRALSSEHARETAAVLRAMAPQFVRLRSLAVAPGTPLAEDQAQGRFEPLDEIELQAEIRALVAGLGAMSATVKSDHALNLLQEVEGRLPDDRPRMLATLDRFLALAPEDQDAFIVGRLLGLLRQLDDLDHPAMRARAIQAAADVRRRYGQPIARVARQAMARIM